MRMIRMLTALAAPLLLGGCLLTPGKFTSDLTINADRTFTFAYQGEVIGVDPSEQFGRNVAQAADSAPKDAEERKAAADKKAEVAKATAELEAKRRATAEALSKEAGYRSVSYLGDGKYIVDYATSGVLTNSFIYPFNLDGEVVFPFIALEVRKGGTIRMKAPAFGQSRAQPGGPAGMGLPQADNPADGIFTLTTDAEIIMHNDEDGVRTVGGRKTLSWRVTPLSKDPPVAVLKMRD